MPKRHRGQRAEKRAAARLAAVGKDENEASPKPRDEFEIDAFAEQSEAPLPVADRVPNLYTANYRPQTFSSALTLEQRKRLVFKALGKR